MTATIVLEQVSTEKAGMSEARLGPPCLAAFDDVLVTWYCTRHEGHKHPVHAAHYDDDRGRSMVGMAWTEED